MISVNIAKITSSILKVTSAAVLVLTLAACGATKSVTKREKPIANSANSTITATGPVVADGVAESVLNIVVIDQNGEAMPGLTPVASASGTGNVISECSVTDINGASTCTLKSTVAETKSVNLVAPIAVGGASVEFVAGPATKLGFKTSPSDGTEGQVFVEQPVVEVQDALGNRVTTATNSIALSLGGGSSGTLSGTATHAAVAGTASFAGLSVTAISADATNTMVAAAAGLTSATSTSFVVANDQGLVLVFSTQPGGGAAGVNWAQQPVVRINDSGGALYSTGSKAITLTLTTGSGSLLGTRTVNSVSGIATFTGLKMETVGAKVLTATASGVANSISNSFTVTPSTPSTLVYAVQPGGGAADVVWAQQPQLRLYDVYGNLCTNSSQAVALTLQAGTGTLSGTTSLAAASGVATFTNLKMSLSGQKSLRATAGSLVADSNAFTITSGAASQMVLLAQPSDGTAGIALQTQPSLEIRDSFDNRVVAFSGTLALALTTGSGTLAGAVSVPAISGVATYSGVRLNSAGTGKIITVTSAGLPSVTTDAFDIVHGNPAALVVTTHPSTNNLANTVLSTQPEVYFRDAFGNPILTGVEANAPVVASLYSGGGVVLGSSTMLVNAGVASFLDLRMSTPGAKVLKFTKPNLVFLGGSAELSVNSNSFNAIVGTPSQLKVATQTSGGTAGVVWSTQPSVEIQDIAGNLVTTSFGTIAVRLSTGTGILLGGTTAVASSGRATFTNLKMNDAGAKVLTASMGTLATDATASFNVTHARASQIQLSVQPSGGTFAQSLAVQPVVQIRDQYGNVVLTGPDSATFINASLLSGSGDLSGDTSVTAVSGVATFTDLSVDATGTKILRFTKDDTSGSIGGSTSKLVDSASLVIQAGTATDLAIVTEPGRATAGLAMLDQPWVEIKDASGNRVLNATSNVTATLLSGTGTLLGTATVTAVSGLAKFTNLQINVAGAKTIQFTSGGLTSVDSASFDVAPGLATTMAFTTEVAGAVVNTAFTTQPVLEIRDAFANLVETGPDATANVTVSVFSGGGVISGGLLTVAAVGGIVTFDDLEISTVGLKKLRFSKADQSGLGGASVLTLNSNDFSVTNGTATQLAFTVQPGGGTAGIAWPTQPRIEIRDAAGNLDASNTSAVSVSLTGGTGTITGVTTVNAVAGVVNFSALSLNLAGTNKVLTATSAGLTSAVSNTFTIAAGVPVAASGFTISAGPKWSNDVDVYTVTVTVRDSLNNPISGRSVALTSNRSSFDTITTSPTLSAANGEAVFTVRSTTGGTSILTAVIGGTVTVTPTLSAVFSDFKVSAAQSSWVQDRVSLKNDGVTLLTLSGTLRNAAGTALPSKSVVLTSDRGGTDVIFPASGTTDLSGQFSFTVKSSTLGVANLTLTCSADAVNVTQNGRAVFIATNPYSEYAPALAGRDSFKMFPGSNASPQVTSWNDAASGGNADGTLLGFAYNSTSSGWMGDGQTTISGGTTGPYRLGFDGTGDAVDAGTSFNSLTAMTVEGWVRPTNGTIASRVMFSNAETARGIKIQTADDGSGRLQALVGATSYHEEVLADAPTSYWKLNETAGTAASVVGLYPGTYTGTMGFSQVGALESNQTAVRFDGTSSYVNIANVTAMNTTANYTYEAWVKLSTAVVTLPRGILSKSTGTTGMLMEVSTAQKATFTTYVANVASTATGTTSLAVNTWYHVVGVRRDTLNCSNAAGKSVQIFVNGVLEGCTNYTGTPSTATVALRIGESLSLATRRFPGTIDEVAMYTGTSLSAARILAHYNAGIRPMCYSTTAMTNDTWNHVAFGYDSNVVRLQINGTEICNRTVSGVAINGSTRRMGLGAAVTSGGAVVSGTEWIGAIGDLRIYNFGVTGSEASQNYSSQSGKYP